MGVEVHWGVWGVQGGLGGLAGLGVRLLGV